MQSVAVDDANPQAGEEAYVLQVSIPTTPGVDGGALMDKIGRFVELYLTAAQPEDARFAQMGGTTWVIAATADAAFGLDQARHDLAVTLFGTDQDGQVQLEWPDGVEPIDPDAVEVAPESFDIDTEEVEGTVEVATEETQFDDRETYDPPAEEIPVFAEAEDQSAFAGEDDAFEAGDDAWTLGDTPGAVGQTTQPDASFFASDDIAIEDIAATAPSFDVDPEADADGESEDDIFVIDDLNDHSADTMAHAVEDFGAVPDAGSVTELDAEYVDEEAAYSIEVATAAQRAAFDDSSDVFEVDAYDIEIVDSPDSLDPVEAYTPLEGVMERTEPDVSNMMADPPETLTEAPERPRALDMAEELNAFRQEMREIAQSIPGANGGDALAEFRAELDAISGALGQRIDGAAQRIESAASQVTEAVDCERLNAAADRATRSAEQLEVSVSEAVKALNTAMKAMSSEGSSSVSGVAS